MSINYKQEGIDVLWDIFLSQNPGTTLNRTLVDFSTPIKSNEPGYNTRVDVYGKETTNITGVVPIYYNRTDIDTLFKNNDIAIYPPSNATKLSDIISEINDRYGIWLTADDYEDANFIQSDDPSTSRTVILSIKGGSYIWFGKTTVKLGNHSLSSTDVSLALANIEFATLDMCQNTASSKHQTLYLEKIDGTKTTIPLPFFAFTKTASDAETNLSCTRTKAGVFLYANGDASNSLVFNGNINNLIFYSDLNNNLQGNTYGLFVPSDDPTKFVDLQLVFIQAMRDHFPEAKSNVYPVAGLSVTPFKEGIYISGLVSVNMPNGAGTQYTAISIILTPTTDSAARPYFDTRIVYEKYLGINLNDIRYQISIIHDELDPDTAAMVILTNFNIDRYDQDQTNDKVSISYNVDIHDLSNGVQTILPFTLMVSPADASTALRYYGSILAGRKFSKLGDYLTLGCTPPNLSNNIALPEPILLINGKQAVNYNADKIQLSSVTAYIINYRTGDFTKVTHPWKHSGLKGYDYRNLFAPIKDKFVIKDPNTLLLVDSVNHAHFGGCGVEPTATVFKNNTVNSIWEASIPSLNDFTGGSFAVDLYNVPDVKLVPIVGTINGVKGIKRYLIVSTKTKADTFLYQYCSSQDTTVFTVRDETNKVVLSRENVIPALLPRDPSEPYGNVMYKASTVGKCYL